MSVIEDKLKKVKTLGQNRNYRNNPDLGYLIQIHRVDHSTPVSNEYTINNDEQFYGASNYNPYTDKILHSTDDQMKIYAEDAPIEEESFLPIVNFSDRFRNRFVARHHHRQSASQGSLNLAESYNF